MTFSKPALALGIVLGVGVLYYASVKTRTYLKKKPFLDETNKDSVLFFTNEGPECVHKSHNLKTCNRKNCYQRNIGKIISILNNAKESLDICMYILSSSKLSSAVQFAIKNGAKVRIISDKGNREDEPEAMLALRRSGAFVRLKEYKLEIRECLIMHHKFVVVDGKLLITGSQNWTKEGTLVNWEDAVVISEPLIIQVFHDEFQRFWKELSPAGALPDDVSPLAFPSISSDWKQNTFHKVFMFGEHTALCRKHMATRKAMELDATHLPYCAHTALRTFCSLIETAEESISVCVHLLTLEEIANRLSGLFHKGVTVRIITDPAMAVLTGSQIQGLIELGLDVRGRLCSSRMHHKFMVLDQRLVLFGSLNWSMQAICGNSENLVCTTQESIVKKFDNHFEELWGNFKPIDVSSIGCTSLRGS